MKKKRKLIIIGYIIKFFLLTSLFIILLWIFRVPPFDSDKCGGLAFLFSALVAIVLIISYPNALDVPKVKPHCFYVNFNNFDDFIGYFEKNIYRIKYQMYNFNHFKNILVYYYMTNTKLEYFIVINLKQECMTKKDFLNYVKQIRHDIIEDVEKNSKMKVTDKIKVLENYILVIDKPNDNFKNIVSMNVLGGYRHAFLVCGYCFDEKILYIANQKDGQLFNYLYVRNKFLKVMNLKMRDRIKII